ncbi:MAG: TRIC cation channel family protein [Candidatus Nanopelagicaceae bacterium]|nr:TRIC cation channel family protein [Candidatus Nanopelagicaceae bacterium]
MNDFLVVLDFLSTFAFALVGARLAASRFMDYGGILFVASVAALTGGTFRNLVLDIPLAWIEKPYLLAAVLLAVILTIAFKWSNEVGSFVLFIDSIGLGVSTVAGTALALDLKTPAIPAILLGLLSAVLGGLTRDLLAQVPPILLHRETNGTAAFIGASALVIAIELGSNQELATAIGFVLVIGIRLISIKRNWNLPKIKG